MNQYNFLINGPVNGGIVNTTRNIMGSGLDLVRILVTGIAIIGLLMLAIRYFTGSPTIKSEQQQVLPDYIMGIFIFAGGSYILTFLVEFIGTVLSKI